MAALAQARLSLFACNLQAHSSPDSAALDLAILSLAAALLISTDTHLAAAGLHRWVLAGQDLPELLSPLLT